MSPIFIKEIGFIEVVKVSSCLFGYEAIQSRNNTVTQAGKMVIVKSYLIGFALSTGP